MGIPKKRNFLPQNFSVALVDYLSKSPEVGLSAEGEAAWKRLTSVLNSKVEEELRRIRAEKKK